VIPRRRGHVLRGRPHEALLVEQRGRSSRIRLKSCGRLGTLHVGSRRAVEGVPSWTSDASTFGSWSTCRECKRHLCSRRAYTGGPWMVVCAVSNPLNFIMLALPDEPLRCPG